MPKFCKSYGLGHCLRLGPHKPWKGLSGVRFSWEGHNDVLKTLGIHGDCPECYSKNKLLATSFTSIKTFL